MPNIVLVRIDNRLIHGQIAAQWCRKMKMNSILVANDAAASSKLKQGLMDMAVPYNIHVRYWSIKETIENIDTISDKQNLMIVCECVQDVKKLVDGGVQISFLNIGNMPMTEGKRPLTKSVAVDEEDVKIFGELQKLGIRLEIRRVPSEEAECLDILWDCV